MSCMHGSAGDPARDTSRTTSIEPHSVKVRPDHESGGVALEVVDHTGNGFALVLDQFAALNLVLKVGAAIALLRGWNDVSVPAELVATGSPPVAPTSPG